MNSSIAGVDDSVLYYIHDPMCSWCWGFAPTWQSIQEGLPSSVAVEYIAGGLAPDDDQAMPQQQRIVIEGYWQDIQRQLGTQFNFDFWRKNIPRRSTYMSCRAAIAAKIQGCEQQMINAIQQAYYLQARNPSDISVLEELARELEQRGVVIDPLQFSTDLVSSLVQQEFDRQMVFAQEISNQGYPSLVLYHQQRWHAITRDYSNPITALSEIKRLVT